MHSGMASAHFGGQRYDQALAWAEKAISQRGGMALALITATASAALLGEMLRASQYLTRLKQSVPNLRASNLRNHLPLRSEKDLQRWIDGVQKAGLPE